MIRVFVYGTLKQGYGNYERLLKGSRFVGKATTRLTYRMNCVGFPFVVPRARWLDSPGGAIRDNLAGQVTGEVYEVDAETLVQLDMLEGNGRMYQREEVPLRMANGQLNWAWMYVWLGRLYSGRPVEPKDGILEWRRER